MQIFGYQVQEANRNLYNNQREADAILYRKQKQADAGKTSANAAFYTHQQLADADLYGKKKEAQGYQPSTLLKVLDGNFAAWMAKMNGDDVQGLQPKISIWSSGFGGATLGGGNGFGGSMRDVAEIYSMLPPLVKTVDEQTEMLPPAWLATFTNGNDSVAVAAK